PFITTPRPPTPTLFPYTTLFRSRGRTRTCGRQPTPRWDGALEIVRTEHFWQVPRAVQHAHDDELPCMRSIEDEVRAESPHRELPDRKSTRLNSSHQIISYAVFCL